MIKPFRKQCNGFVKITFDIEKKIRKSIGENYFVKNILNPSKGYKNHTHLPSKSTGND